MLTQSLLNKLGVMVDQPIKLPMFSDLTIKISSNSVLVYPEDSRPLQWQFILKDLQTYLSDEHDVKTVIGASLIDEVAGTKWLQLELVHILPDHRTIRKNQDMPSDECDLELVDDEGGCMYLEEPSHKDHEDESLKVSTETVRHPTNVSPCPTGYVQIANLASFGWRASIEPERMGERSGGAISDLIGITKPKKLGRVREKVFDQLKRLADEQPNCAEAIELVHNALYAAYLSDSPASIPNLLLHGAPGTGKTRLMRKIAEIIGLPFCDIPLAGTSDVFKIVGMSKYWQGSDAGLVARTLSSIEFANPIFLFDEIDKVGASQSQGHNPLSSILLLLEPETAKHFRDDYLEFEVDVSAASFVATANNIEMLPDPLLSRFVCIEIPSLDQSSQHTVFQNIYRELCASERYGIFLSEVLPAETCEWLSEQGKTLEIRKLKGLIKLAMQRACASLVTQRTGPDSVMEPINLLPSHFLSNAQIPRRQMGFI